MDNSIMTINADQLKDELKDCITLKKAALVCGPPGVGKTDITSQVAKELGSDLLITHPVVDESIDYKGMPAIIDGDDGKKEGAFLPFGHLKRLIDAESPLIVLIDDIGQAQRLVQAAIMQLVLNRAINGVAISEHVSFVMCTNRAGDRAGADAGLLEPLKSRSVIYQLAVDVPDWVKWALTPKEKGGGGHSPCLAAFMRFKPECLNNFKPTKDMVNSPSPRCWSTLGDFYNAKMGNMVKYAGCVGDGAAAMWTAFEKTWTKLPKIESIIMNPLKATMPDGQLDVLYATCGSVAHHANEDNIDALMQYIDRMPNEFAVTTIKDMIARDEELMCTQAFISQMGSTKMNNVVFGDGK